MRAGRSEGVLRFSVAILSHKRPHLLPRVLWAISQLDYPLFEIVVVGDLPSIHDFGLPSHLADQVKYVEYVEPNICRSRNLAVELSSGDVVAFCDDDAVPEPDWLSQLARAFAFPDVGAVGGLVRGMDGLTVEWAGGVFDRTASERAMVMQDKFRVFDAESQVIGNEFVGTMGANSAFLREAVQSIGGFDEAYRYYLDETDLMLRLAEAGWDCGIVLDAEVHHLREENSARDTLRTPRNLFEIAASKAYFCRRHVKEGSIPQLLAAFRANRERELDPYIRLGLLRSADRQRLLDQVDEGVQAGLSRAHKLPKRSTATGPMFKKFRPVLEDRLSVAIMAGWGMDALRSRRLSRRLADAGHSVSCISYLSGFHAPRVGYAGGVWLHSGGTWRWPTWVDGVPTIGRTARGTVELNRVGVHRRFDLLLGRVPAKVSCRAKVRLPGFARSIEASLLVGSPAKLQSAVARLAASMDDSLNMGPQEQASPNVGSGVAEAAAG